jgi:hypothetical protein
MKSLSALFIALALICFTACEEPVLQEAVNLSRPQTKEYKSLNPTQAMASMTMEVYFNDEEYNVNMFELPEKAAEKVLNSNQKVGEIYTYCDLDEECDWDPIVDSVPGQNYNPLWQEIEIEFAEGVEPYQFTSDEAIEEAAEAGEITLTETDEVYRCAVIGKN